MSTSFSNSASHVGQDEKTIGQNGSKVKTGSILVLDDDLDINALIKMALQKQGYRVFGFTDPFLALEHFKNTHSAYSLVISDLRMPGINGFEFIQRIRTINSKVKILLMTAFEINESDFARVLPKLKINGFVQKPISMKSLVKTVKMCAIEN